jgi:hypothetical protein
MADHYRQGLMFEACQQGRHAALHDSVNTKLVDHVSPDNPDLGKTEHFAQRASAFLRPVIGSCSTNRNQQYWNLIGEKAEFNRDGHRIAADHRARAEPMHFGGI